MRYCYKVIAVLILPGTFLSIIPAQCSPQQVPLFDICTDTSATIKNGIKHKTTKIDAAFSYSGAEIYGKSTFPDYPVTGISFDFNRISDIPLILYAGNLSFSKSISSLKKPGNFVTHRYYGLGAVFSGEEQPDSVVIRFTPGALRLECACSGNSSFLFSIGTISEYRNSFKTIISFSGGRFFLEPHHDDTWYRSTRFFRSGWYDAGLAEISLSFPQALIQISSGIHQSPFGELRSWIRNENRITAGCFFIGVSFFTADNFILQKETEGILCTDNTILHTLSKFKLEPQFTCFLNTPDFNRILQTGISLTTLIKQEDLPGNEKYRELQSGYTIKYTGEKNTIRTVISITRSAQSEKWERSATLSVLHKFTVFSAEAYASFIPFSDGNDSALKKLRCTFRFSGIPLSYISFYIIENSMAASVFFRYSRNRIRYTGIYSAETSF